MKRPYLDPDSTANSSGGFTVERLPEVVRNFGLYPDISRLQAGDVVLVSPTRPDLNAKAIMAVQGRVHSAFDAQWMHAAAYLGENSLVEISQHGVAVVDLSKYVPKYRLLFRRPRDLAGGGINELTGHKIAVAALMRFKTRYSMSDLIQTLGDSTIGRFSPAARSRPSKPGAICSTFYNDAVARVLGRGAASAKVSILQPADLAVSTYMDDLDIPWMKLP